MHERDGELNLRRFNKVAVVGVGGVGSWVAYLLTISDQVDELLIIDPDIVEESNLTRTPYNMTDVGRPKVTALAEKLVMLGRSTSIIPIQAKSEDVNLLSVDMVLDNRDFVSDEYNSSIVCGYDGRNATVHINPTYEKIFRFTNQHGYTVPSYITPPVVLASMIVEYVLNPEFETEKEIINTYNISDMYKMLMGIDKKKRKYVKKRDHELMDMGRYKKVRYGDYVIDFTNEEYKTFLNTEDKGKYIKYILGE